MSVQKMPEGFNQIAISKQTAEQFTDIAGSNKYLARLQLMGSTSKLATAGKMQVGRYAVIRSESDFNDLGNAVDLAAFAWRAKAMHLGGDAILNYYDQNTPEFIKVCESADAPNGYDRGDSYGPEFLMWVPKLQVYATFFMASKTAKREAGNLMTVLKEKTENKVIPAATFKSQLIKGKKNQWWGPVITECSTPLVALPNWEKHQDVVEKFLNPPVNETEQVSESEKVGTRDR